jgi:hypothetical protein
VGHGHVRNRKIRIMTFQSAKTDITYTPHADKNLSGVASLPK